MSALRPTIRVRLTALYGTLFAASAALLMAVSYWLMSGHLGRTLPAIDADAARAELLTQYGLGLAGSTLIALALGWAMAGRVLSPVKTMTATARRVSQDRLHERIELDGPEDELRELADTVDAMLDRLGDAFDAQQRFIANASHELRSPLTVIRTEADVALADPEADTGELRAMGEAVLEATDRTDDLLDSLMVLARSQGGLLRMEPVDLATATRAAEAAATAEASARRIEVRHDLTAAVAHGDPGLIERLVGNLIENGIRYNRPGGFVSVFTGVERGRPVVRVANSGPAVPPHVVGRLTEPFERGGRRCDGGAGLGLSIVRSVSDAHGARMRIEPRPEGGLLVEVAFPGSVPEG